GDGRRRRRALSRRRRERARLPRRARRARRVAGLRASLCRRRSRDRGGCAFAYGRASPRARARHRRARRLRLRPAGDDGSRGTRGPRGRGRAPARPLRTIRPLRKELHMRKAITAVVTAVAMGIPIADAAAAARKVVTVTKTVAGPQAQADRWG